MYIETTEISRTVTINIIINTTNKRAQKKKNLKNYIPTFYIHIKYPAQLTIKTDGEITQQKDQK